MPDPLRPSTGNGIGRESFTSSLRVPDSRTEGGRAIRRIRSHSNLGNLAASTVAADDEEEQPFEEAFSAMQLEAAVAAQASVAAQRAPTAHATAPHPTPLSAAAITQGKVAQWMAALSLQDRAREMEAEQAEQADVAAATAELQALALIDGFPAAARATIQPSPRLPVGCDECYDGGVMPCPDCEEAMNLAATGCRCEPGGITGCDHPNCRAAEYDMEDEDEEMDRQDYA